LISAKIATMVSGCLNKGELMSKLNELFYEESQKRLVYRNDDKRKIAQDILERYTGGSLPDFGRNIILTNFKKYMEVFQQDYDGEFYNGSAMSVVHSKKYNISMIDFKIGAPTAALIIEVLSVIDPQAVLFLGMCGGLHKSLQVGDFILPMAAIRDEGVSRHFLPPQVPSLPTFKIQKFISQKLVEDGYDYRTGVVHTTDYRFWEFNEEFKRSLYEERAIAIDMECAALFSVGFATKVPIGALLLVSDLPLTKGDIKTKKSAGSVFRNYTDVHVKIGIQSMIEIQERGEHIRHYRW